MTKSAETHPFVKKPHRTLWALTIPVLFSLIAEPITGVVDTAFVARLGANELAALGVGTTLLSSVFWIFNFLSISTQTEVAQSLGQANTKQAAKMTSLALLLGGIAGILIIVSFVPTASWFSALMGADGTMLADSVTYIQWRALGAPAVLLMAIAFGAMRGQEDMRTPLWLAIFVNVLNIGLDALLIFGWGPIPAYGIAGAAVASSISQWLGAILALYRVRKNLGLRLYFNSAEARRLIVVGGDLFVRTGMLTLFMLLATRAATSISAESGAAHQAIRQVWLFSAFIMEAFAVTGQTLAGYFFGSQRVDLARRVAATCVGWCFGTGILLAIALLLGQSMVATLVVPAAAVAAYNLAWPFAALLQPISGLAFVTDGFHWGSGDYRYLRNGMLTATLIGGIMLALLGVIFPNNLLWVWVATAIWIVVRALFGLARVWPGVGDSPYRPIPEPLR